ncbi:hypothetical protein FPV67DRAFT_1151358 [Lyophyllum atratum]|nr:hypothetical protein FPV67DRAFT_1151358 [Lyophyllum atratum]
MSERTYAKSFMAPPLDGSLCIPEFYDWHFANNFNHPVFTYPHSDADNDASRRITYGEFVPALHRAGRILGIQLNIDLEGDRKDYPVVAILSTADTVSQFTVLVGLLRLGVVGFPISPRFSAPVVAHLLQKAGVTAIFINRDNPRLGQLAHDAISLVDKGSGIEASGTIPKLHSLPLYDDMYWRDLPFEPLPKKTYDRLSPALIVHSSNSSSQYPKAVPWSVRMQIQHSFIPTKSSRDLRGVIFSCHSIELFHTLGLFFLFWVPTSGPTLATFKPSSPAVKPTSELAFSGIRATKAEYALTHTRFLEIQSRCPI